MGFGKRFVEWPTLAVMAATWAVWLVATSVLYGAAPVLATLLTGIAIAQHASLQHEALHGHPFRAPWLNEGLMTPAPGLTVPYGRFRDTHLAHHFDPVLTDPYDDPETNYFAPEVWVGFPTPLKALLTVNNTLIGRIVLGPIIGTAIWLGREGLRLVAGEGTVRRDWALHLAGLVPVLVWVGLSAMPVWAYLMAVWIGHGLLKIRTFLEHRAHAEPRARTVIVEDRGPLSILFLNNNFHAVHHMHPKVPWYRLPALYAANRDHYLRRNGGYSYTGYGQVFRRFLLRRKDPLAHPGFGRR